MTTPRVSIIVPNYNHASFLRKRLSSLLDQSYTDFELIFFDDASTDDSRSVFEEFTGDHRVRSVFNKNNSGSTFRQWNRGVAEARGEYVWIAESDDFADRTLLEKLVARLEENPRCGLAYCQSYEVDDLDNVGRTLDWVTDGIDSARWKRDYSNFGPDECQNYLLLANTIPNASAVVFRKSAYVQADGANESMKLCGDWLMWTKILGHSDIEFVAEPLNYFRQHSSTVRAQRIESMLFVFERYQVMAGILATVAVPQRILEPICVKMADIWEAYTRRDPVAARCWQFRVYRQALKVDPRITQRLLNKTVRPWIGSVKNRLLRGFVEPRQR